LEYAVVLAVVFITVIVLAMLGVVSYAVHRIRLARFKLTATGPCHVSFSVEVESQQEPPELPPAKLPRELPPGASDV
jgi:hypothetical protein